MRVPLYELEKEFGHLVNPECPHRTKELERLKKRKAIVLILSLLIT